MPIAKNKSDVREAAYLDRVAAAERREAGGALAYDPMQHGSVPGDLVDASAADAWLDEGVLARFERETESLLSEWVSGNLSADEATERSWRLPEQVIDEFATHPDATDAFRSRALAELQARAAEQIGSRIVRSADREARATRCASLASKYRLRAWRAEDAARYVELLSSERVWEHLPEEAPHPLTLATAQAMIELSNESRHHEVRAIERDGRIVGQVRLEFVRGGRALDARPSAEISYWLGVDYWGRGIASEVVELFTRDAFDRHGLTSIHARIREENRASVRVVRRAGYLHEGRMRSELEGDSGMQIHRCFRSFYFEPDKRSQASRRTRPDFSSAVA